MFLIIVLSSTIHTWNVPIKQFVTSPFQNILTYFAGSSDDFKINIKLSKGMLASDSLKMHLISTMFTGMF